MTQWHTPKDLRGAVTRHEEPNTFTNASFREVIMKINKKRGLLASAGALVTAVALALGGAAAAQAAPTILPTMTHANLHIHKLPTPAAGPGIEANGIQAGQPGGPAVTTTGGIDGVQFSIKKVDGVNLATNAGWQAAGNAVLDLTDPANPVVKTSATDPTPLATTPATGSPFTTTGGGIINANNLPIGLYLVQETVPAAGSAPAVPFLVTLPMTNPSNNTEWMTDIYVYPKNSQTAITKTVSDVPKYQAGSPNALVTWTINADVPRTPGSVANSWVRPTSYVISDAIANELAPQTVTVKTVDNAGNDVTGVNELVSADYTISPATLPAVAGTDISVTFTTTGLDKLQALAASAGNKVRVTVGTLVVANATGTINNSASVTVNGGTPMTSTPAATVWNNVSFKKVNQENTGLAAAEFQVFGTEAAAQTALAGDALLTSTAVSAGGTAPDLGGVNLGSLVRSDHLNGSVISDPANYRVYWLVETKAPDTYELLAKPVPFVVMNDGAHQVTLNGSGQVTAVGAALAEVVNVKHNAGFTLPLTGGMGTAILTIGGIAILAIVLIVARRRRDTEANAE